MINHARMTGSPVRKDPVDTIHPFVRIHPVTGEKCLFLNGEFLTKIQGLKEPEQRWLLDFLMNHIVSGHDFQARVRWQPRTIVIFDNRCTLRKCRPGLALSIYLTVAQILQSSTTSTTTTARNCDISFAWSRWPKNPFRSRSPSSSCRAFVSPCCFAPPFLFALDTSQLVYRR